MAETESGLARHLAPAAYRTTQEVFVKGEWAYLYAENGKRFIDFVQGIAVNNLGHCHPEIVEAIRKQAGENIHSSFNLGFYNPALKLAEKLTTVTPGELNMFFFANSGAEAVEGGLKLSRYKTGRKVYIGFKGAFHGRTMGALSMTTNTVGSRARYEPLLQSIYHVSYPYCYRCPYKQKVDSCSLECFEEFSSLFTYIVPPEEIALILIEPAQGEGGYIVPPEKYMNALAAMCKDKGILLCADEIQTGLGRTGKMFGIEHFGITPDIMLLGKALGGGLPLSVVASRKDLMDDWAPGAHGTTFGANPVACAASLAYFEVLERDNIIENCRQVGSYFKGKLEEMQQSLEVIGDVRGFGLFLAIELVDAKGAPDSELTQKVVKACHDMGLLLFSCGSYKNCIRFIAPLTATKELIDEALAIVEKAIRSQAG